MLRHHSRNSNRTRSRFRRNTFRKVYWTHSNIFFFFLFKLLLEGIQEDGATAHTVNNSAAVLRNILADQMVRRHWWPASCPSDALLLYSVGRFKAIARKNNPHTPTQRTNLKNLSRAQQRQFETKISKKSLLINVSLSV